MMHLTTTKLQRNGSQIYYVTSESDPSEKHFVVVAHGIAFCDCADFMTRRLPLLGENFPGPCKHGKFVQEVVMATPPNVRLLSASKG